MTNTYITLSCKRHTDPCQTNYMHPREKKDRMQYNTHHLVLGVYFCVQVNTKQKVLKVRPLMTKRKFVVLQIYTIDMKCKICDSNSNNHLHLFLLFTSGMSCFRFCIDPTTSDYSHGRLTYRFIQRLKKKTYMQSCNVTKGLVLESASVLCKNLPSSSASSGQSDTCLTRHA